MLISCNRLKHYIKNCDDIDFETIWNTFTMKVAEVESVTKKGEDLKDVVTAQIISVTKHPDSQKLSLLKVTDGKEEYDIVCGAPNVKVGLIGALVKVGGMVSGQKITKRKLAGYESFGMMCAWDEIGVGDDHGGILELPDDTPLGVDLTSLYPIKDIIVEIDNKSLTNRPDLWGHYGIAREIAAITDHELLPLDVLEVTNNLKDLDITISEPNLCNRYCGIKVKNLVNNQTPVDMQIFLTYVGMRSISLFVDLTNFLMLELGQPMHAFDERVVKSIDVKLAKDNDTYTTLDNVNRLLNKETLMITNGENYFGIAGIMGGLDSEILNDTTSIFVESANFQASSIRKSAVRLGLRTEASARYEKSLDPNLCLTALKRFLYLLKQSNPNMEIASNLTDIYPNVLEEKEITLKKETIKRYTTIVFSDEEVVKILNSLGFKVEVKENSYKVLVPTFRATKDVSMEADLIEELIRIHGYDKILELPLMVEATSQVHETIWDSEYIVKRYLASSYALNEIHSYLWYDNDMLNKLGIIKDGVHLLTNAKNNLLRDDLSLSLLPIVKENLKHEDNLGIFEIGTVIKNNQNHRHLSIILADDETKIKELYYKLKTIVTSIFQVFKHQEIPFGKEKIDSYYNQEKSQSIICNGQVFGHLKVFDGKCMRFVGKKKVVLAVEIYFNEFMDLPKKETVFQDISKYPDVNLDYTILAPKNYQYAQLADILKEFKSKLIKTYHLVDVYNDDNHQKYTLRYTIGSNEKTLNKDDLDKFKNRFITYIKEKGLDIVV